MKLIAVILLGFIPSFVFCAQDSLFTEIHGDSVIIWDKGAQANCASRFQIGVNILSSNVITVTEIDTLGPFENCVCTYNLSLTLLGLDKGHYVAQISRQQLKKYHYDKDTTYLIGITEFNVDSTTNLKYQQLGYQSACLSQSSVRVGSPEAVQFILESTYPNPFNPSTTIQYTIQRAENVRLTITDAIGQTVITLVNGWQLPGTYRVTCDGSRLPSSGAYYCTLTAGGLTQVRKMIKLK